MKLADQTNLKKPMRPSKLAFNLGFVILFHVSCSGSPTKKASLRYPIQQIAFSTLKFRRPPGLEMDPAAGPGGMDYQTKFPVADNFSCEDPYRFFNSIDFKKGSQCLASLKHITSFEFKVIRDPQPFLELVFDEENQNKCLLEIFSKIALPREIVFLAKSKKLEIDQFSCFSSRLDLSEDRWMDARLPINGLEIKIPLPLSKIPATADEFERLLVGWTLGVFFDPKGEKLIWAQLVANSYCKKCIGRDAKLKQGDPDLDLWPNLSVEKKKED